MCDVVESKLKKTRNEKIEENRSLRIEERIKAKEQKLLLWFVLK